MALIKKDSKTKTIMSFDVSTKKSGCILGDSNGKVIFACEVSFSYSKKEKATIRQIETFDSQFKSTKIIKKKISHNKEASLFERAQSFFEAARGYFPSWADFYFIEEYAYNETGKIIDICEFTTVFKYLMSINAKKPEGDIFWNRVSPLVLKSFIGAPSSQKEDMMAALLIKTGVEFDSDDIADAFALSLFANEILPSINLCRDKKGIIRSNYKDFLSKK